MSDVPYDGREPTPNYDVPSFPPCEPAWTEEEIAHAFTFHPATPEGADRHKMLSEWFIRLTAMVNHVCPNGREKALVKTKLEEAKMWASAAVARNPDTV